MLSKIKVSVVLAVFVALVAWLASPLGGVRGETEMPTVSEEVESRNKALVLAGFEAWRTGTGSPYDLLAEDVQWTIVGHSLASHTHDHRPGPLLVEGDGEVRVRLVVLVPDVEARPVRLDQVVLEEERRDLVANLDPLDGLRGRAGTLLAVAAIVTSFLGSIALPDDGLIDLGWFAIVLFLVAAAVVA